jgi:hypothetical protein
MAQVLVGYDVTGSVLDFDADGNILAGGDKLREVFILPMSRLLVKDEIKKGTFNLQLGVGSLYAEDGTVFNKRLIITDESGSDGYFVNSPAGEYGVLFATGSHEFVTKQVSPGSDVLVQKYPVGLIYYQAGIAIVTASIFMTASGGGILHDSNLASNLTNGNDLTTENIDAILTGSSIFTAVDNFRTRMYNLSFNNTTELNSTIYFCRVRHDEFNYSSNPTYLTGSKIRVKTNATDDPVSYISTIGLYSSANELMAVAKLSEPLKKTPSQEFTLRVRLDY